MFAQSFPIFIAMLFLPLRAVAQSGPAVGNGASHEVEDEETPQFEVGTEPRTAEDSVSHWITVGAGNGQSPTDPFVAGVVAENLYFIRLGVEFPLLKVANFPVAAHFGAGVKYPRSINLKDGQATLSIQFTPGLLTAIEIWKGSQFGLHVFPGFGVRLERTQYAYHVIDLLAPEARAQADIRAHGWNFYGWSAFLRGGVTGSQPLARYHTSGEQLSELRRFSAKGNVSSLSYQFLIGVLQAWDAERSGELALGFERSRTTMAQLTKIDELSNNQSLDGQVEFSHIFFGWRVGF